MITSALLSPELGFCLVSILCHDGWLRLGPLASPAIGIAIPNSIAHCPLGHKASMRQARQPKRFVKHATPATMLLSVAGSPLAYATALATSYIPRASMSWTFNTRLPHMFSRSTLSHRQTSPSPTQMDIPEELVPHPFSFEDHEDIPFNSMDIAALHVDVVSQSSHSLPAAACHADQLRC